MFSSLDVPVIYTFQRIKTFVSIFKLNFVFNPRTLTTLKNLYSVLTYDRFLTVQIPSSHLTMLEIPFVELL